MAAAELEGSKAYAKAFMSKYSIPTARYEHFNSYPAARDYMEELIERIVIKVDGLAAGKGVVLPENRQEAQLELREMMLENKFGPGQSVIIEERLQGPEISVLTFSDGISFKSLPPGQDHKRIFDGNRGPNTGGMGVYAPVPFVSQAQMQEIDETIVQPTLEGMRSEGTVNVSWRSLQTTTIPGANFSRLGRPSLCRNALYRHHVDASWAQSARVQCAIWRSRDPNNDASHKRRPCKTSPCLC